MSYFYKILISCLLFAFVFLDQSIASTADKDFDSWIVSFKEKALKKGISKKTLNLVFKNVKFLDQVIKYDRKQPEFFEDTLTYVNKRANNIRIKKANILF